MKNILSGRRASVCAMALALAFATALAGCASEADSDSTVDAAAPISVENDSAVIGEYTPYDPSADSNYAGGKEIEGSEEEKLQQERIAGGAVGGVTSVNLEPIEGIVDYSEGEYSPLYGLDVDPPAMGHEDHQIDCTSCHYPEGAGAAMPDSHLTANLAGDECATCHKAAEQA